MANKWLSKILPMECLKACRFVDFVTGDSVGIYREKSGRVVMATSAWSLFRVSTEGMKHGRD